MDFKTLETFCAVARLGNLRQAANRIGRTIPAISIQIRKLEEEIAIPLFHHTPNRLVLTQQGRRVSSRRSTASSKRSSGRRRWPRLRRRNLPDRSRLRSAATCRGYFAPRIAMFARTYPDVHLSLISGPTSRSLALVTEHESDLGIGFYRTIPRGLRKVESWRPGSRLSCPGGRLPGDAHDRRCRADRR